MDQSTFITKYLNSTGALDPDALTIFLVDAANVASKAKLREDASDIAEALHNEGLDSWDDLRHITQAFLKDAGMRGIDAAYLVRRVAELQEFEENEDELDADSVEASGNTSESDSSVDPMDSQATEDVRSASTTLVSAGEAADEEVQLAGAVSGRKKLSDPDQQEKTLNVSFEDSGGTSRLRPPSRGRREGPDQASEASGSRGRQQSREKTDDPNPRVMHKTAARKASSKGRISAGHDISAVHSRAMQ